MIIAPKTDMFNQLACLTHYPTTSSDGVVLPPASTMPTFPSMPHADPQQPDNSPEDVQDAFTPYLKSEHSFGLGMSTGNQNASMPVFVEIGGVVLDKIKCRKSPEVQKAAAQFQTGQSVVQVACSPEGRSTDGGHLHLCSQL
jgi:hypothetical protein